MVIPWDVSIKRKKKMKPYTWKELFDIAQFPNRTIKFIKQYNYLGALALSVAKWHPKNPNRGRGNCGLCEYQDYFIGIDHECKECFLAKTKARCCHDSDSYYYKAYPYISYLGDNTKYANLLYNIILEEYKKVFERNITKNG